MKSPLIICSACSIGTLFVLFSSCAAPSGGGNGNKTNLSSVTKDAPFVNSLGMKFVPVPGTNILMCTTETTVAQCRAAGLGNPAPQFAQGANHPAVNINSYTAAKWCKWLSQVEGRKYRLPTDLEWSSAVGTSEYPWGSAWPPPNNCGNYAGQEMRGSTAAQRSLLYQGINIVGGFSDRHIFTAPVGSYPANSLGLHDLGGNVWELCSNQSVYGQIIRGGSWLSASRGNVASSRVYNSDPVNHTINDNGFRVVVEL